MSDKLRAVGILQKQLMGAHYARALDAKRDGRPIVYVTAIFPVEIVKAFEPHIATVYPENHAAMLSANGKEDLAQEAIAAGLDRMGCAYELINTGYILAGHGRLEAPDLTAVKGRNGISSSRIAQSAAFQFRSPSQRHESHQTLNKWSSLVNSEISPLQRQRRGWCLCKLVTD